MQGEGIFKPSPLSATAPALLYLLLPCSRNPPLEGEGTNFFKFYSPLLFRDNHQLSMESLVEWLDAGGGEREYFIFVYALNS